MHREELAASRPFDKMQEQQAPFSPVIDITPCVHLFYECTFQTFDSLLVVSVGASMRHIHALRAAVHTVPYVYDVLKFASVCSYALGNQFIARSSVCRGVNRSIKYNWLSGTSHELCYTNRKVQWSRHIALKLENIFDTPRREAFILRRTASFSDVCKLFRCMRARVLSCPTEYRRTTLRIVWSTK